MKKVYIAGCGGMLGEAFYNVFRKNYTLKCSDIDLNEDWIDYLDFRNYDDYRKDIIEFNPDYLFHLGAHTDLEYCELNSEDAYDTNTRSVKYAVSIANELKIPILFISTAGIFNGEKDCYDETEKPDPIGVYGRSKYLAEVYVKNNANNYLICRAGWMMGGGTRKDKKFVQKIISQITDRSKEIFIVNDKLGTPTYTYDFAKNLKLLIENNCNGLYNMVCRGLTSRLEIANEIVKQLGLQNQVKVTEVSSDFFKKEYFAARPKCERLVNKRLNSENLNIMRDWRSALTDYINSRYYNQIKK